MRFKINPKYGELQEFLQELPIKFDELGETIYKGRNTLKVMQVGEYLLNVKSFKVPHLINRIAYAYLRGSKARHSFEYGMQLKALGVNTPEPVAFLETFKDGVFDRSFYVSIHISYSFTINDLIGFDFDNKDEILRSFTRFTYEKLHKNGVHHLDYSRGNILISQNEQGYHFSVVDINRMRFEKMNYLKGLRNFSQIWANEDELEIVAREYALLNNQNEDKAVELLIKFDRLHKAKINNKKRWKQFFRTKKKC